MSGVDAERFWAIVGAARDEVDDWSVDLDQRWAYALYAQLVILPADEVLDFDRRLATLRRAAQTPEMAAATQIVLRPSLRTWHYSGPAPYDLPFMWRFHSFVTCLVMLGRASFERAVEDPDSLADHPLIQMVATGRFSPAVLLAARVDDAAGDAYCELTGVDENGYLDLLEPSDATAEDGDDEDDEDDSEYGAEIDPDWLAERLPCLMAMFYPEAEPPAEAELAVG
jgi:hypothetical protein